MWNHWWFLKIVGSNKCWKCTPSGRKPERKWLPSLQPSACETWCSTVVSAWASGLTCLDQVLALPLTSSGSRSSCLTVPKGRGNNRTFLKGLLWTSYEIICLIAEETHRKYLPSLSILKHVKCVVSTEAFSKGGVRAEGCWLSLRNVPWRLCHHV